MQRPKTTTLQAWLVALCILGPLVWVGATKGVLNAMALLGAGVIVVLVLAGLSMLAEKVGRD